MRKWRKMTWAIVVWCSLILIWAIAGGGKSCGFDFATLGAAAQPPEPVGRT